MSNNLQLFWHMTGCLMFYWMLLIAATSCQGSVFYTTQNRDTSANLLEWGEHFPTQYPTTPWIWCECWTMNCWLYNNHVLNNNRPEYLISSMELKLFQKIGDSNFNQKWKGIVLRLVHYPEHPGIISAF